jgi:hypothetical protein
MEDDPPYLSAARLHRQAKLNCFGMKQRFYRTPFQGEWARNRPVLAALSRRIETHQTHRRTIHSRPTSPALIQAK